MRRLFPRLITLFTASAVLAAPASAGVLDILLAKADVDIVAVTDLQPAGAALPPVTPEKPVYYFPINGGYSAFGETKPAGKGPPAEVVTKQIITVLAKQGYRLANTENPPSLVLVYKWGALNPVRIPQQALPDFNRNSPSVRGAAAPSDVSVTGTRTDSPNGDAAEVNQDDLLRFMGAYKFSHGSKDSKYWESENILGSENSGKSTAAAEAIGHLSLGDLHVITITAYDYQAVRKKEYKILWMTRIACSARGVSLDEAFPNMLAVAGPSIGKDTPTPVWVNATERFKGNVKIGELTVVKDETSPAPAAPANPPAPAAAKSKP